MLKPFHEPPRFNAFLDIIEAIGPDDLGVSLATPEYADFPGREFEQRYARLAALMEADGLDAVILTQEENVRYMTGYLTAAWVSRFRPYLAILPRDIRRGPVILVPGLGERRNAEVSSWISSCVMYPPQESPVPHVTKALRDIDLGRGVVGLELGFGQRIGMTVAQLQELVDALPEVDLVDATPVLQTVRMLKSDSEVDRLERACRLSEDGVKHGWEQLRPGMTERELVAKMAAHMFEAGSEVGTKPILLAIMAGDRWSLSNGVPSDYPILNGDLVLVDGGATFRGYVCDFMRQAVLGEATPLQRRWFDALVESNDAAIAAVRPGVVAHEVYATAQASFAANGLAGNNRSNIIGHGIGMDIHEIPWIGDPSVYTSDIVLREGMVLSIEPALVQKDEDLAGHFTLEDVVAVTSDGARNLTGTTSKQLLEIPSAG